MPRTNLTIETGKLMATVANLQDELNLIKKEMHTLMNQMTAMHDELVRFMASVQTKSVCERLHSALKTDYVQRAELAPFKTILGAGCAATVTAICVALLNLIFK